MAFNTTPKARFMSTQHRFMCTLRLECSTLPAHKSPALHPLPMLQAESSELFFCIYVHHLLTGYINESAAWMCSLSKPEAICQRSTTCSHHTAERTGDRDQCYCLMINPAPLDQGLLDANDLLTPFR